MQRVLDILDEGTARGLHLGYQVYVSRDGEPLLDHAAGDARPGVAMAGDTLTLWMSAGKPLTAVAAALQVEAGRLDLHAPVADVIPGFAAGGKAGVTLAHVLTHTGGFRKAGSNWSPEPWDEVVARVCQAPLEDDWVPGETAGYHVAGGWYVLGELVRRADPAGRDLATYLRDEVMRPAGMDDAWVGMPRRRWVEYNTRVGMAWHTDKQPPAPLPFPHSAAGCTLCRPGGNARGPARELGRFYEWLLRERRGRPVLRGFTSPQRVGLKDRTFGTTIDWGYGFLTSGNARVPYGYGRHASPAVFGHSGNQSSCGFADPEHGLAVAWVTNGLPGELAHQKRQRALNEAIYEAAGLSG